MEIIIIMLIGYLLWKIFNPKNQQGSKGQGHLTETQRRWREQTKINNSELNQQDQADDEQPSEVQEEWRGERTEEILNQYHDEFLKNQQRVLDMQLYLRQNMRKFNIWEWFFWQVDSRFLQHYLFNVGCILFGFVVVPMLMGLSVFWSGAIAFIVFFDIRSYLQHLLMEVTAWNPEWHEKFGRD